ncbi:hypothetical protein CONPUDRAFT_84249 [Coniophora puteana RWD-64-598 SS2]|uniref:Uncharacterized protein n=1 Tax=Coniophora puteana (strain RWD-64-598) TaxID=741705 RepID=A0A5M3MFM7_CONPW|nr:uncharacterized protein CONPUDRAFT_84249 [Coniophora puteana RWD-64-598 SS2]EIW78022.1 hypothetical protein CONPUDRAFT_84249 [Coniophora puteana RWD-64-598 SS2]
MSLVGPPASHNEVPLTREMLIDLLGDMSEQIRLVFGCKIRLFVHGGAVMILHPSLSQQSRRRTTRDVDYIRRAFGHEWRKMGIHDAETKLQICINATALRFRIGSDWMNADPDVALPFARNANAEVYDPIYHDSKQPNNVSMNAVFDSPFLTLIAVTPFWGVALKLVRYKKEDPSDIAALLRHGTTLNGVQWTPEILESWLTRLCWPMGYNQYQGQQLGELRDRIRDAVRNAQAYDAAHGTSDMQLVSQAQIQPPAPPASADPFGHGRMSLHSNMFMQVQGPGPIPISPTPAPQPSTQSFPWGAPSQPPPPPAAQHQPSSWEQQQPPVVQSLQPWHSSSHVPSPPGFVPEKRSSRHRESRRHRTPSPAPPSVTSMRVSDHWPGHGSSHSHSHSHSHPHSHPHSHLAAPPIMSFVS